MLQIRGTVFQFSAMAYKFPPWMPSPSTSKVGLTFTFAKRRCPLGQRLEAEDVRDRIAVLKGEKKKLEDVFGSNN
jgi:hypothetical protein